MYKGRLIVENLSDLTVLNYLDIEKTEQIYIENNSETVNVISFTSKYIDFPFILSAGLKTIDSKGKRCFASFEETKIFFIVMKNDVMSYNKENAQEKEQVIKRCIELGVDPEEIENEEVRQ